MQRCKGPRACGSRARIISIIGIISIIMIARRRARPRGDEIQWLLLHPGKTVDARTAMPRGENARERLHKDTTMELIEDLLE